MLNVYDHLRDDLRFQKFETPPQLIVEYNCPIERGTTGVWSPLDAVMYGLSGEKTFRSGTESWTVGGGKAVYLKKGGYVVEHARNDDFCHLVFFLSDEFMADVARDTITVYGDKVALEEESAPKAFDVDVGLGLETYFHSVLALFSSGDEPSDVLLKLKLRELVVKMLLETGDDDLSGYLRSVGNSHSRMTQVMESNFSSRLSLAEYAELCGRSLASFKRDFKRHYGIPPGRWLKRKRLDYSVALVASSDLSISEVCFESGFGDVSHFSRVFKERFGSSPSTYRQAATEADRRALVTP